MSPKRKKLEAALDGLFSTSRKPIQPEPDVPSGSPDLLDPVVPGVSPLTEEPAGLDKMGQALPPLPETPAQPTAHAPGDLPRQAQVLETPVEAVHTGAPASEGAGAGLGKQLESPPPAKAVDLAGKDRQLVVFNLAGVAYGLDIDKVESIIKMQAITTVPHAREWVEGVTNLRGTVLPVIDPRKRFSLPSKEAGKDTRIMVINVNGEKIGIVVDAVSEVLRLPLAAIEPPPPMVTSIDSAFVTGIAKVNEKIVILLDAAKVVM